MLRGRRDVTRRTNNSVWSTGETRNSHRRQQTTEKEDFRQSRFLFLILTQLRQTINKQQRPSMNYHHLFRFPYNLENGNWNSMGLKSHWNQLITECPRSEFYYDQQFSFSLPYTSYTRVKACTIQRSYAYILHLRIFFIVFVEILVVYRPICREVSILHSGRLHIKVVKEFGVEACELSCGCWTTTFENLQ